MLEYGDFFCLLHTSINSSQWRVVLSLINYEDNKLLSDLHHQSEVIVVPNLVFIGHFIFFLFGYSKSITEFGPRMRKGAERAPLATRKEACGATESEV